MKTLKVHIESLLRHGIGISLAFLTVISLASVNVEAGKTPKGGEQLTNEMNFHDKMIRGKYLYSAGTVATVEKNKSIEDLISIPKHFKNKISQDQERY